MRTMKRKPIFLIFSVNFFFKFNSFYAPFKTSKTYVSKSKSSEIWATYFFFQLNIKILLISEK